MRCCATAIISATWRTLTDYARAHLEVAGLYADPMAWTRKAIINVACSGKFSSDRTIVEYAERIWGLKPSPIG
jgi:starch phosphorylase